MPFASSPAASFAPALTSTTGFTIGNSGQGASMSGGNYTPGSTAGWAPAIWTTPVETDSFSVKCTLNSAPASTSLQSATYQRSAGCVIKSNIGFTQAVWCGVDSAGCYILTTTSGSGGGITLRASTGTAWSSGDVMLATVAGGIFTIYRNGTFHVAWTDASTPFITANGFHRQGGLYVSQSNFTASCSLKLLTIADTSFTTPVTQYAPMLRSSTR